MNKYGEPIEIGRFLRSKDLRENDTRVHLNAFLPQARNGENKAVSCFQMQNLDKSEIFNIAEINNIKPNGKLPAAYCLIMEKEFPKEKLNLDYDDNPERHLNILGWEKYEEEKDVAIILAEFASKRIFLQ